MCTFLSLTVNASADPVAVQMTVDRLGFRFVDAPHPKGLPTGRRYLAHDSEHCDCGTSVGSAFGPDAPSYLPSDLSKLRKQGWSEARIARWTEQKLAAEAKNERAEADQLQAAHQDLVSWVGLIRALLDTPTVRLVGLMHDFYASGPGYDDLPLVVEEPKPITALSEEALFRLPGGTLLEWASP